MAAEKTILLVDDNVIQAAVRQTILKKAGYFVITALDPIRALEMLRSGNLPADVDLVITDHIMPAMTGTSFVKEIRLWNSSMPILVITGLQEAADQYEGLSVAFRLKPLPPEQLLESVHQLLASKRQILQPDSGQIAAQAQHFA